MIMRKIIIVACGFCSYIALAMDEFPDKKEEPHSSIPSTVLNNAPAKLDGKQGILKYDYGDSDSENGTESYSENDSNSDDEIKQTKRKRSSIPNCSFGRGRSYMAIKSGDGESYYCRSCYRYKDKDVPMYRSREAKLKNNDNIYECPECNHLYVLYRLDGELRLRTRSRDALVKSVGYPPCKHCKNNSNVRLNGKTRGARRYYCAGCNKCFKCFGNM
jgi:hypothetical protein